MGSASTRQYAESVAFEVHCITSQAKANDENLIRQQNRLILQPVTLYSTTLPTGRSTSLMVAHTTLNENSQNLSNRSSDYQKSEFFLERTLENMSVNNESLIYSAGHPFEVPHNDSYKLDLQDADALEEKHYMDRQESKICQLITNIQGDIGRSSIQSIKGSLLDLTVE